VAMEHDMVFTPEVEVQLVRKTASLQAQLPMNIQPMEVLSDEAAMDKRTGVIRR